MKSTWNRICNTLKCHNVWKYYSCNFLCHNSDFFSSSCKFMSHNSDILSLNSEFTFCNSDLFLRILSLHLAILTFFYDFWVYISQFWLFYLGILSLYLTSCNFKLSWNSELISWILVCLLHATEYKNKAILTLSNGVVKRCAITILTILNFQLAFKWQTKNVQKTKKHLRLALNNQSYLYTQNCFFFHNIALISQLRFIESVLLFIYVCFYTMSYSLINFMLLEKSQANHLRDNVM